MSFRAQRVARGARVSEFDWGIDQSPLTSLQRSGIFEMPPPGAALLREVPASRPEVDSAEIEREAFTKGYAQGERAGAEAAATRGDAMLRRLAQTIDELGGLRADL